MAEKKDTITLEKATVWKIATGVLALIVIVMFLNKGGTTPAAAPAQPSAGGDQFPIVNLDMKALADDGPVLGQSNAPLTIVEFSDFQCPFCERFFSQTEASIKKTYIDTGKARLVYRNFPLSFHQNAQNAAEAAACANEQGKFWDYHNKLFGNNNALNPSDGSVVALSVYEGWAKDVGLDAASFKTCIESNKFATKIAKDSADGGAAGIQGTPGFFIGKTDGSSAQMISGAYPFSAFQQVIDAQLKA